MNTPAPNAGVEGFSRILLCVDGSPASEQAVAFVRRMAQGGTTVRIASIVENPRNLVPLAPLSGFDLGAIHAEILEDAEAALARAQEAFAGLPATVEPHLIDLVKQGGDVVHAIAAAAHEWRADVLVLGARQHRGLLRWVEGTVSEPVTRLAPCPTIVVPGTATGNSNTPPKRILFAIDGSETSSNALRTGARLVSEGACVRIVYVVDRAVRYSDIVPITLLEDAFVEEGRATLAQAKEMFAHLPGLETVPLEAALVDTETSNDDIAHAIVREAQRWNADLLALGTHGRRGPARWLLGSVASHVARIATTPLMLVHKDEQE
jgi:nucleotide-binding universal stress UspA family protein